MKRTTHLIHGLVVALLLSSALVAQDYYSGGGGGGGSVDLSTATGNLQVANVNSGTGASSSTFLRGDMTWASPSVSFPVTLDGGTVFGGVGTNGMAQFKNAAGTGFTRVYFGPTNANGVVFNFNPGLLSVLDGTLGTTADVYAGTLFADRGIVMNSNTFNVTFSSTRPTVSSGFGTTPAVAGISGSAAFQVTVGSGGVATTGVLTMAPTAQTGWACDVTDITTANQTTRQTAYTTTTVTITTTVAWTAADKLLMKCAAF